MFEQFRYDKEVGKLYLGEREAGWLANTGYRMVSYKKKKYLSHRVIWYLHYGKWPSKLIDHIDQNKLNNHISNLRDADSSTNLRNQGKIKGFHKVNDRYRAQISRGNKVYHIGMYDTQEQARAAYLSEAEGQ